MAVQGLYLEEGRGGGTWRREKEGEAEWERHFNRKTVTSQVAKGAPKKPQSGIGNEGKVFQPGLLRQEDLEGSKHRAATGQMEEGELNEGINLRGGQVSLEFPMMRLMWDLRTRLVDGQVVGRTAWDPGPPFSQ